MLLRNNKYYVKMFDNLITKVWEDKVKKPAQNLSDREYTSYLGSRDFLLKLRKELDK